MYKIYMLGLWTIIKQEIRRFLRIWIQTLLPPMITLSLYFLVFGNIIGSRIGQMQGFSYIQFVVPGLIMMSVINNSFVNVVSSFFSLRYYGAIEDLIIAPLPNYIILLGYITGGIIRGLLVGILALLVSAVFTQIQFYNVALTLLVAFLASSLFSIIGFINALFAKNFDDISIFPTFILTPLIYVGGVFYSINILSPIWQKISLFNPIFYIIDAFRYALLGEANTSVSLSLFCISVFILIFYLFAIYTMRKPGKLRK